MTLKSGLAEVYIYCKTDVLNIVSVACNLMTFWDDKKLLEKILVDVRLKPIGRYKVEVDGNINWGCEVVRFVTVYVNLPVLGWFMSG